VDHTDDPDDRLTRIDELLRVELNRPDFLFPSLNYWSRPRADPLRSVLTTACGSYRSSAPG
jgi:hypothetical protein